MYNIITVTREYGAGGAEVAKGLAERLGWELLDRQLLHSAAEIEHVPDADMERLDEKALSVADRFRLHPPHERYMHGLTAAVNRAVDRGNVVLVGRGTRHLVGDAPDALHIHLMAPQEWRVQRMAAREGWSPAEALARCTAEERMRQRFMLYFFAEAVPQPANYHLLVNTSRIPLADVVDLVAALARNDWPATQAASQAQRVLTLARELGAGDKSLAPALGIWLGLRVYDRELLEQEAARIGIPETQLAQVDERKSGLFRRLRTGGLEARHFEGLRLLMQELADRGEVLLVGRGGSRFLRDHPRAFNVRVVAPMAVRLRRVMEHRWLREEPARKLIDESDANRRGFYQYHFAADWTSPLEYHLTVNSGQLGPAAVDVLAFAAERHWSRAG